MQKQIEFYIYFKLNILYIFYINFYEGRNSIFSYSHLIHLLHIFYLEI